MGNSLVSIITPMYNSEKTIVETIDSVLSQTYSNWEMIIIDDCSTDNSFKIVNEYVSKDKRIVLLKTDVNSGTAATRNVGIKYAKGKYIAFLDSDDLWKENKLQKQISFMDSNNYVFSYSDYYVEYSNGKIKSFKPKRSQIDYKHLLKKNDIGCLTAIYDVEKLGKIFMPLDAYKREEYAAWLDITKTGVVAYKLNEELAVYRSYSGSLTGKKGKLLKCHYNVYRKHECFSSIKSLYYLVVFSINKKLFKYR